MKKYYKQTYIALAIKKVRFCLGAKDAEQKNSAGMKKPKTDSSSINAKNAAFGLFGEATFQKEDFSAMLSVLLLTFIQLLGYH
jgi:hypothetical protein